MKIYAIGDLHFGYGVDKSMHIFGENWNNHGEKIQESWRREIQEDDVVLLAGDTSWAMDLTQAEPDFKRIADLPGKKIFIGGNHDYWWDSTSKVQKAYPNMVFLKNESFLLGELAICGTRGWLCPNDARFTDHDCKIYEREQIRLRLSLDHAMRKGAKEILVMFHYPPTNDKKESSAFIKIIEEYPVKTVVYGHLHGKDSFGCGLQGCRDGIAYHLVSSDYLDFVPKQIIEE